MSMNKKLLLVAHAPSSNTEKMVKAIIQGATHIDIENVSFEYLTPLNVQPQNIQSADAIILFTTENLGYMSGLLKDMFDRCYYTCLEKTQGLPVAVVIRAGHDGTGTQRALETILTGLRWRWIQDPLICKGDWQENFIEQCEELGLVAAASLDAGII